jgi:DnaJ-domain-containing protein 1
MKKTIKPAGKKPGPKKPVAKKTIHEAQTQSRGQPELAQVVARLDTIADKLADATTQLVEATVRLSSQGGQQPERQDQELEPTGEVMGVVLVDESEGE